MPVTWKFESVSLSPQVVKIVLTANLLSGWHMYTQFMDDQGAVPTKIELDENQKLELLGVAEERGVPLTNYDEACGCQLTWYSETVSFVQRVKITQSTRYVKGLISYLACDNHVCIPQEQQFIIDILPKGRTP